MTNAEMSGGEQDPRLADPDQYFLEHYGSVVISYNGRPVTIEQAQQFERLARSEDDIAKDSPERRASIYIDGLRSAGALRPEDDVAYIVEGE